MTRSPTDIAAPTRTAAEIDNMANTPAADLELAVALSEQAVASSPGSGLAHRSGFDVEAGGADAACRRSAQQRQADIAEPYNADRRLMRAEAFDQRIEREGHASVRDLGRCGFSGGVTATSNTRSCAVFPPPASRTARVVAKCSMPTLCCVPRHVRSWPIAALEERKLEYILGARERGRAIIRHFVLGDEAPLTPLLVERARGETQLFFVKEVKLGAARYVLCRNEAEAERERDERAIGAGLAKQLARGDKALIGNSAYRRYLRRTPSASGKPGPAFEIEPAKLAEEARFDGVFVLRTNARITALQAVLRYRDLLQVEDLFRRAKAILGTRQRRRHPRPCLLLLPRPDAAEGAGRSVEIAQQIGPFDNQAVAVGRKRPSEKDGKRITTRTAVAGQVGSVFQVAGIALPPNLHERAA